MNEVELAPLIAVLATLVNVNKLAAVVVKIPLVNVNVPATVCAFPNETFAFKVRLFIVVMVEGNGDVVVALNT